MRLDPTVFIASIIVGLILGFGYVLYARYAIDRIDRASRGR